METPLISIIIPTYNRAHLISETLDSIIAQTYTHWECIVVDDGSTDNTSEVMAKYTAKDSRFQYHHRPKDKRPGGNAARNYGFELSSGNYIQWFDSDDLMPNRLIEAKVKKIFNFIEVDFVVSGFIFSNKNKVEKVFEVKEVNDYLFAYQNDDIILNTLNVLWKRSAVSSDKWDEKITKYQDLDFIFRVLCNNVLKGVVLRNCMIMVYHHSERISNENNRENNMSRIRVRENNYFLSKSKNNLKLQKRLYHLYLFELRNILSLKEFKLFFYSVIRGKVICNTKIKINLLIYMIIYLLFSKGLVRLTKYMNKISV